MTGERQKRGRLISAKQTAEFISEIDKTGMKIQEVVASREGVRIIFVDKSRNKQSAADKWIEDNA